MKTALIFRKVLVNRFQQVRVTKRDGIGGMHIVVAPNGTGVSQFMAFGVSDPEAYYVT